MGRDTRPILLLFDQDTRKLLLPGQGNTFDIPALSSGNTEITPTLAGTECYAPARAGNAYLLLHWQRCPLYSCIGRNDVGTTVYSSIGRERVLIRLHWQEVRATLLRWQGDSDSGG